MTDTDSRKFLSTIELILGYSIVIRSNHFIWGQKSTPIWSLWVLSDPSQRSISASTNSLPFLCLFLSVEFEAKTSCRHRTSLGLPWLLVSHWWKKQGIVGSWDCCCCSIGRCQRHVWTWHRHHVLCWVCADYTGEIIPSLVLLLMIGRDPRAKLSTVFKSYMVLYLLSLCWRKAPPLSYPWLLFYAFICMPPIIPWNWLEGGLA
jgi:hypothetical protein